MEKFKQIGKNTAVQIFGKGITTTLGVLTTIILTRYLGPSGYGNFVFVSVFLTLFGVISDWGFNLIAIREASQDKKSSDEIISNTFSVKIFLGLAAVILANIFAALLGYSGETRILILIGSAQLVAIAIKTASQIVFNVVLKLENWAASEIVGNLTVFLATLYIVNTGKDLLSYFWFLNLAYIFSAATAFLLARKYINLRFVLNKTKVRYLLKEAIPMGAILAIFTVYNRLDTIILEHYWGAQIVGWYGAAYRIFDVLVLGAAYFANAVLPDISWQAQHDKKALWSTFKKSFFILLVMGITVASINFILAPLGIDIIAGTKFEPAVIPLRILSFALVVSYFNHLTGYTLIALKKQNTSLKIALAALAINLVLNLILIPRYSLYAAAATTFITEGLITSVSIYYVYKYLH